MEGGGFPHFGRCSIMPAMKFGICTSIDNSQAVKDAGWDFVEESVQNLLQGLKADTEWDGAQRVGRSALPVPAANVLVPGAMKIVGPAVDFEKLRQYMGTALRRAGELRVQTLVFGSGAARTIPDGWTRDKARQQILDFIRMSAQVAEQHEVTLVAEPLNQTECNIINSVAEAMEYVRTINHPNFQCLVDSFHFWLEDEPLENLRAAMPWIRHVHLADRDGRTPPGESGLSDYRPFFRVLKEGGYDRLISVEASGFKDFAGIGPRVLAFVKKQWEEA
jgi:sugar phosphate isomerase/epimerase